jgi:hypothetical protein
MSPKDAQPDGKRTSPSPRKKEKVGSDGKELEAIQGSKAKQLIGGLAKEVIRLCAREGIRKVLDDVFGIFGDVEVQESKDDNTSDDE